jgi:hypothetical protein
MPRSSRKIQYPALRERFRYWSRQESLACESAENARAEHSSNVDKWQSQCDELMHCANEDVAEMRAVLQAHGIPLKDAGALGLW